MRSKMRLGAMLRNRHEYDVRAGTIEDALKMVDPPEDRNRFGLSMERHMARVGPPSFGSGMSGIDEAHDSWEAPGVSAEAADQHPRIPPCSDQDRAIREFPPGGSDRSPINDILAFAHRSPPIRRCPGSPPSS
jgi:hypothetical protein